MGLKKEFKACDIRRGNLSLSLAAAQIMRWCLYISSILILLTLGVELCSSHGVAWAKDTAHLACVLDDGADEIKQCGQRGPSFTECDLLFLAGQQMITWVVTTDLILPLKEAEIPKIRVGVRRHRWLCRERC